MNSVLVDRRNIDQILPSILSQVSSSELIGVDCETEDSRRHPGLERYNTDNRHVFDNRRTTMTGFSIYAEGADTAYYFNLAHADVQNRLRWSEVLPIFEALNPEGIRVAHNAPYELTMFKNCVGHDLTNLVCTLQMAVSDHSPDEYALDAFVGASLGTMKPLMGDLINVGRTFVDRNHMTKPQSDLFNRITTKESHAKFSYNGFVSEIAIGYGLKQLVRSLFGVQMTTYKEVLGKKEHMGQLTGEEVVAYGADDAYYAVLVYRELLARMIRTNPAVVQTFFEQENPMIHVYADIWREGLKVDLDAIRARRVEERGNYAATLRRLRGHVRELLPFGGELNQKLAQRDKWYATNGQRYRDILTNWARAVDGDDRYEVMLVSGSVSKPWAAEVGGPIPSGPNLSHYMPVRVLLYDLLGATLVVSEGKTQSDGEARGNIMEQMQERGNQTAVAILECLNEIAGIEQRMKLYLNAYEMLTDPETLRMYPVVSSMLATRRMACKVPNAMQLAKRGASTYVRGFYEGDSEEHLVLSLDWSGIELVEIGEFSKDPSFKEAYGQLPHQDLHGKATAAILSFETGREITVEQVKALPRMTEEEVADTFGSNVLIDSRGQRMSPEVAYKFHRGNDGGKGANFNYWYSGALGTIGEKRGWSKEQMWGAVESYRATFPVAEQWRQDTIRQAEALGYVQLPDGHRRTRFEATDTWVSWFTEKFLQFHDDNIQAFVREIARKIRTRARNQAVNALIQGTCATIAKRSILRQRELGWHPSDCRFLMPIHDELVFSVHYKFVLEAIRVIRSIMCDHPDIFPTLKLDCSPAIGRTFEPWHPTKAPFGQIELNEAPDILGLPAGKRLNNDQILTVVDYLMSSREPLQRVA